MDIILSITFPLYAAIAIGYAAVRFGWFKPEDMRALGRYVLDIALPALLFRAVASRDLGEVINPSYMLVFAVGGLITIATTFVWFNLTAPDRQRRAMAVMGSTCPNSGYIGYPLMLLLFPDLAGVLLAMNFLVENFILVPICLILMDLADRGHGSIWQIIRSILKDLFRRPLIIGLLAGLLVSLAGIPIPDTAMRLFDMLAASASALALVVIGGSLVGLPLRGNKALAAQIAGAKLLWHPAMTAVAASMLAAIGWATLSADLHRAVILSAAIPMFGIFTLFAQERGLGGAASIALLAATSGAFVTLSAFIIWTT